MNAAIFLAAVIVLPAALIWLAKRDARKGNSELGDESIVLTGAETDAPRIISAAPPRGPQINGAEVEDQTKMQENNAQNQ